MTITYFNKMRDPPEEAEERPSGLAAATAGGNQLPLVPARLSTTKTSESVGRNEQRRPKGYVRTRMEAITCFWLNAKHLRQLHFICHFFLFLFRLFSEPQQSLAVELLTRGYQLDNTTIQPAKIKLFSSMSKLPLSISNNCSFSSTGEELFHRSKSPARTAPTIDERLLLLFQQQSQLLLLAENGPRTRSLSSVTGSPMATHVRELPLYRQRRHAAQPGTMQLQEAKRKSVAATTANSQDGQAANNRRQVIHAVLKGQVVLPCNLQPSDPDDAVSLVLWYKDKSMVPIYTVDARSSPIQEARHKPGLWLEGRSSVKIFTQRSSVVRNRRQAATLRNNSELLMVAKRVVDDDQENDNNNNNFESSTNNDDDHRDDRYTGTGSRSGASRDGEEEQQPRRSSGWRRRRKRRLRRMNGDQESSSSELDQNLAKFTSTWSMYSPSGGSGVHLMHELPMTAHESVASTIRHQMANGVELLPKPMALTASASAQLQQQLIAHLYIDSLSSEDNGVYVCRVDFRKSRSSNQESVLKIIVPADKPTVRDLSSSLSGLDDGSHAHRAAAAATRSSADPSIQVLGPHNEGSKVVLECETQGGYPEPMLTWWRNGRLVDDSYEIVSVSDGQLISQHAGSVRTRVGVADDDSAGIDEFRARTRLVGNEMRPEQEFGPNLSQNSGQQNNNNELMASFSPSSSSADQMDQADGGTTTTATATATISASITELSATNNKQVAQNRLIRNRLELSALTRQDLLANYSCQAWNTKLSEPPTTSIMIDMNLRPIKVQIDNERQPVLADKPLDVICRAFGSRPAALISWYRGSTKLTPAAGGGRQSVHHQQRDTELFYSNPYESNQLHRPTPSASHPHERDPSSFFQVQVQIQETISGDSNITTSTLSFVPQLDDGGQIITCKAENPYWIGSTSPSHSVLDTTGSTIEDSWKLEVHYLPRVKLQLGEKLSAPIKEGHDVYFECTIKAHPLAHEVRWWFESKELESNVTHGIIISNQSLVLQRVNRHQRGRYTCSAINSVGESHSNSVHLRVQYTPFCRDYNQQQKSSQQQQQEESHLMANDPFKAISQQRFKTHYGAARLESVKVYCHVDADPIDSISYKWAFVATQTSGSSSLPTNSKQRTSPAPTSAKPEFSGQQLVYLDSSSVSVPEPENPLISVASYMPRSELDYGTLLCWAQNALGQQAEPCAYQIVPAERPDPVRNCRLVNASDTQLTVACEPGYDGGIDQSFQMEVYDTRKHELVANVSSNSLAGLVNSGANKGAWWPNLNGGGGGNNELPPDVQDDNNNTNSYQEDDSSLAYDPSAARRRPAAGSEPASLVSEPIVSRQQKQRHSSQQQQLSGSGTGTRIAPSDAAVLSHPAAAIQLETVFTTQPNLRPATDYFLSIYSTNSKGSSKPVAFTATTMNLSSVGDGVGLMSGSSTASVRDGRRADPSHLLSDVLALSWNPFLLVCAITVLLFIMFASITFAMMKYVDFSTTFNSSSAQTTASYGPCLSSATSLATNQSIGGRFEQQQQPPSSAHQNHGADNKHQETSNRVVDDEDEEDQSSSTTTATTATTAATARGQQRARVITVATASNNGTLRGEKAHNIPLNGNQPAKERSSILNGSYLKFKLQQLTGHSQVVQNKLRQSNSDNFLNQLANNHQLGPPHLLQQQYQQQQLLQHQYQQAGASFCGTLPKNMSILQQRNNQPLAAFTTGNAASGFIQQVQLQKFENPHGIRKYSGGTPSPEGGASAATYSAATSTSGVIHPPPTLSSLMLTTASANNTRSGAVYPSSASGYDQAGAAVSVSQASSMGGSSGGHSRVEQLVISGKQYIHQTSASSANHNMYRYHNHQQQQQQPQQQHLQLTSCAPYGSLQRGSNLHTGHMNSMKDYQQSYLQIQNSGQQQQQIQNQNQKGPLVCISHRSMIGSGNGSGGNNHPLMLQSSSNTTNDQATVIDGACLANLGANVDSGAQQAVDTIFTGYNVAMLETQQQQLQQLDQANQLTKENYSTVIASDSNSVINNTGSNGGANQNEAARTSDLGDELPPLECDNILASAVCHVAHLTLIDGGDGAHGLDSDGLSSGTQRSLTTNGSPSSGIAEIDQLQLHQLQQQHHSYSHHHHHHQHPSNQYIQLTGNTSTTGPNNQSGSTSTITSDQHESDAGCGNVISVSHASTADNGCNIHMLSHSTLRATKSSAVVSTTNGPRHLKKSFNSKEYLGYQNNSEQLVREFEPHLDQYTMYVDGNDTNNNLSQFYVLPDQEVDRYSNRARVRLVSANDTTTNLGHRNNSQQQPAGALYLRSAATNDMSRSTIAAAAQQVGTNLLSSEQRAPIQGASSDHLHTEV